MCNLPRPDGLLLFARYAFMPNRLGFCGGPNEHGLFEACVAAQASPELRDWARQFEGAYPYLVLIARAINLPDPLDYRVVEAYWLGNDLLDRVGLAPFYDSLRDRFRPRLSAKTLELLLGKVPAGSQPFHAFHVLEVCRRTGALAENLETLDNCRISWGRVQSVAGAHLLVETQRLRLEAGQLVLGPTEVHQALRQIDGRGFAEQAAVGDWVSIHWGWACEVLTPIQLNNLRTCTQRQLVLASQTL